MSTFQPLEARLAQAWPPDAWQDVSVLVAISGGPDSVALLLALQAIKTGGQGRLLAAHFNHRLRGPDAEADEAFVVQLCRQIGVPCEVGRANSGQWAAASPQPNPLPKGEGMAEAAARHARYDFLQETAARLGARYVVTGHTADDQAETILHRILRGTGIAGLAGMARARPLGPAASLIRPLLDVRRAEVLEYLDQTGQPFRRDRTNEDPQFTRNRIRTELLPSLAARYNPAVIEAILRLGCLAGEVQSVVDAIVDDLVEQAVDRCRANSQRAGPQNQIRVSLDPLGGQPRYVVRELLMAVWRQHEWPLQAMGFEQWDLLADMAMPGSRGSPLSPQKRMFPGGILAETRGDGLWLAPTRGD